MVLLLLSGPVFAGAAECSASAESEHQTLVAHDGAREDFFGSAVDLDGRVAVIGAWGDDDACPGFNCWSGAAYVFERTVADDWSPTAKLVAADAKPSQLFGNSVTLSDNTVAVGAYRDDHARFGAGAVYLFRRDFGPEGSWSQTARLVAPDAHQLQSYGASVALHDDILVVGAPGDDERADSAGAAYVYLKKGDSWSFTTKLVAFDGMAGARFGYSVAASRRTIVIGAPGFMGAGAPTGYVYTFEKDRFGSWIETNRLSAPGEQVGNSFGAEVDVDGDTLIVGASAEHDPHVFSGAAYTFRREPWGIWRFEARLADLESSGDEWFGWSVAIASNRVLIGAFRDDDCGVNSGAAYLFQRTNRGRGTWEFVRRIVPSDLRPNDELGFDVAIDGASGLVGASHHDHACARCEEGAAYLFDLPPRSRRRSR